MKIVSIFLIPCLCLGALLWFFWHIPAGTNVYKVTEDTLRGKVLETPKEESVYFLGDIMLARDVEKRLKALPISFAFSELPFLNEAKAVVGNFEASVPSRHEPTPNMAMKFSVDASLLPVLNAGGLTHLSLANNHALDYGHDGYANTVNELRLRDFKAFGHPTIIDESSISYFEAGSKKLAVVGINATYGQVPETWTEVLKEASRQTDMQIAYVHWGAEYELLNDEAQQELAHQMIDAGFDLIIGHHPHVVQNIERYQNGLIFYSLGNFLFDQYWNDDVSEGLILELVLSPNDSYLVLHPVESKTTRVKPRLMIGEEKNRFLMELGQRSSASLQEVIGNGRVTLQF